MRILRKKIVIIKQNPFTEVFYFSLVSKLKLSLHAATAIIGHKMAKLLDKSVF